MARYILKKILYGLLLLLGVITLVFFLFTVLPSDPARMMMGLSSVSFLFQEALATA